MRFLTALLLLVAATLASAKIWGWADEFSIIVRIKPPKELGNPLLIPLQDMSRLLAEAQKLEVTGLETCPGLDSWCGAKCRELQHYDIDGGAVDKKKKQWWEQGITKVNHGWARIQRENAGWIDLWRRDDGKYDMYENGKVSPPHGYCERPGLPEDGSAPREKCSALGSLHVVSLVCYQY